MEWLKAISLWRLILLISLFLGGCLVFQASETYADGTGTTYYINNLAAAGCSNEGQGTQQQPWCDFTPVNSRSFGPGDELLLARGAEWNQELALDSRGSSEHWIRIGAYGEGERPKIIRNGNYAERGLRITNPSYLRIEDLEVGEAGAGIYVYFSTLYHEGLRIGNVYVHDNYGIHQRERLLPADDPKRLHAEAEKIWSSAGILFTGSLTYSKEMTDYAIRDIRIDGVEGTGNQNSISFDWNNGIGPYDAAPPYYGENLVQDVLLTNLYLHDDNPLSTGGCDDGLRLINISNAVIMNSVLQQEASCHSDTGTAAVLIGRAANVHVVNSVITDTLDTASPDMAAIDYEGFNQRINVRNSYFARNAGAGLSILAIHGDKDMNADLNSTGNMFVTNGSGSFRRAGKAIVPSGTIKYNLYHELSGLLYEEGGADFSGFTVEQNADIANSGDMYYAAVDYDGGTQAGAWSYQYKSASAGWQTLVYDEPSKVWQVEAGTTVGAPQISAFQMKPGYGEVARVWTASRTGTVEIRGMALQEQAEGSTDVSLKVTRNNQSIISALTSEQLIDSVNGIETNVHHLLVTAGDVIRFEVEALPDGDGKATVSWTPAIAYSNSSVIKDWTFGEIGNASGWTVQGAVSSSNETGSLKLVLDGTDAWVESPDHLNIQIDGYGDVSLSLKNETDSTEARLYFTTADDGQWTEDKSMPISLKPMSGYQEYFLPLWDLMGSASDHAWSGQIRQLRLVFGEMQGTIDVGQFRMGSFGYGDGLQAAPTAETQSYYVHRWEFNGNNDLEGWSAGVGTTLEASAGVMNVVSQEGNAYMVSPNGLGVKAAESRYVELGLLNHGFSGTGKLYYTTALDPVWSNSKVISFSVPAGASTYKADMKASQKWKGEITQLRFDPAEGSADVDVDYLRISSFLSPPEEQPYLAESWGFNVDGDMEKWRIVQQMNGAVIGGVLQLDTTGGDPYMLISGLKIDAATSRYLTIRMKTDKTDAGTFFFTTATDPAVNSAKKVGFSYTSTNGGFSEFTVDAMTNPLWTGEITSLRFDPGNAANAHFEVDNIQISSSVFHDPEPYTAYAWNFAETAQLLGWYSVEGTGMTADAGGMTVSASVYAASVPGLKLNTELSRYVMMDIDNSGSAVTGRLYYVTSLDPQWDEVKSVAFSMESGYQEYRLDMRGNGWQDQVTQLRFRPEGTTIDLAVRSIRISRITASPVEQPYIAKEWGFNTAGSREGWSLNSMLQGQVLGGVLKLTSTGSDPYMVSPGGLHVDSAASSIIVIRAKSSVDSTGNIFFLSSTGPGSFTSERRVEFSVKASSEFVDYVIDMGKSPYWTGDISTLRLDPLTQVGQFEIDFIRIMTASEPSVQ